MKIENITILGPAFTQDGYGSHVRQLSYAINKHLPVRLETNKPDGWEHQSSQEMIDMCNRNFRGDATVFIGLPHFWELALSTNPKNFVGFLVWECDKIPQQWADICNDERVKQIWTPSKFTKESLVKSGVPEDKVFVVSHGVNLDKFKPTESPNKNDKFTFLYCKGWVKGSTDRSGFQYLVKAFSEEFGKDEPVRLIAKLNQAYLHQGWDFKIELDKLNLDLENSAEIGAILENVPFDKLLGIYAMADVMCVPTCGEGFGLTYAESMACGVPCIATEFGGQTDFVTKDNGWLIPHGMQPANDGVMYEECSWAKPDIKELKKVLRHVYNNRDEVANKAKKSLEDIQTWTWDNTAKLALDALSKL